MVTLRYNLLKLRKLQPSAAGRAPVANMVAASDVDREPQGKTPDTPMSSRAQLLSEPPEEDGPPSDDDEDDDYVPDNEPRKSDRPRRPTEKAVRRRAVSLGNLKPESEVEGDGQDTAPLPSRPRVDDDSQTSSFAPGFDRGRFPLLRRNTKRRRPRKTRFDKGTSKKRKIPKPATLISPQSSRAQLICPTTDVTRQIESAYLSSDSNTDVSDLDEHGETQTLKDDHGQVSPVRRIVEKMATEPTLMTGNDKLGQMLRPKISPQLAACVQAINNASIPEDTPVASNSPDGDKRPTSPSPAGHSENMPGNQKGPCEHILAAPNQADTTTTSAQSGCNTPPTSSSEISDLRHPEEKPAIKLSDGRGSAQPTTASSQSTASSTPLIRYYIIKSRRPKLSRQPWRAGSLEGKTFDQLCDEVASLIGRTNIHRLNFELTTSTGQYDDTVSRDEPYNFDAVREDLKEEITRDMEENETTMFEVSLEPDPGVHGGLKPETPTMSRRKDITPFTI